MKKDRSFWAPLLVSSLLFLATMLVNGGDDTKTIQTMVFIIMTYVIANDFRDE